MNMGRHTLRLAGLCLAGVLLTGCDQSANIGKPAVDGPVVVSVNGTDLHESQLRAIYDGLPDEAKQLPYAFLRDQLVDVLVNRHLMSVEAEKAGYANNKELKQLVAQYQQDAMRDLWLQDEMERVMSPDRLRAIYDEQIAELQGLGNTERHARHILVEEESAAKDLIAQLDEGADFVALANEHSIDTASVDGDLGFFGKGMMVKPFEDAAFGLAVGSYTPEPIQSQFGWHVIIVEEERAQSLPSFAEMREDIARAEQGNTYRAVVDGLRADATIELPDSGVEESMLDPLPAPAE
jgi:peptidyl-prolyl cis-trans isomerase C